MFHPESDHPKMATPMHLSQSRLQHARTETSPLGLRIATAEMPETHAAPISPTLGKDTSRLLENDIEDHPEDRFLSPFHPCEYDDWDSDSDDDDDDDDDDGEGFEWDAGITDFALFDSERKRADAQGEPVSEKWNTFLTTQADALHRALERSRSDAPLNASADNGVPDLTPDGSPNPRDLDIEPQSGAARLTTTSLFSCTVKPLLECNLEDEEAVAESYDEFPDFDAEDEDELPLAFHVRRRQQQRRDATKPIRDLQRPGLRNCRTLSGKLHSWRRPSWHIYSIGEWPETDDDEM